MTFPLALLPQRVSLVSEAVPSFRAVTSVVLCLVIAVLLYEQLAPVVQAFFRHKMPGKCAACMGKGKKHPLAEPPVMFVICSQHLVTATFPRISSGVCCCWEAFADRAELFALAEWRRLEHNAVAAPHSGRRNIALRGQEAEHLAASATRCVDWLCRDGPVATKTICLVTGPSNTGDAWIRVFRKLLAASSQQNGHRKSAGFGSLPRIHEIIVKDDNV